MGNSRDIVDTEGISWLPSLAAAVVVHGLVAALLVIARQREPVAASTGMLSFRLQPPPEGQAPMFMASSNPEAAIPPEGQDQIPDAEMTQGGELLSPLDNTADEVPDAVLAEILSAEREALREELENLTELAAASTLPQKPLPMPPPDGGDKGQAGTGPEGAVRELDLGGFPQPVVDDIMKRYKLKVVTRRMEAGRRGQSFLSSASKGKSETYFGGLQTVQAGVYEVFQLSRESVALMSRLEEEALKKEGLEPLKSRVIRIVFGIVKSDDGGYELGVKNLEAEPVK